MRRILATVPALALIAPGAAAGTIESYLSFQARLTDNQGEPLGNGYHTLDFFVYAEPSGGTPIGAILNVMVHLTGGNGVVSTPIGPADLSWFADAPRYIGVTIDDVDDNPVGDELSPRVWLTAVPFALRAFDLPPSTNLSVATGYVAGNFKVDGNIGVGILNPAYRLQILAPLLPPSGFLGTGRGGLAVSGGVLAAIDFTSTAGGGFAAPGARIAANVESTGTWLTFGTSENQSEGVTNTAMVIGPDGRVGLNNPNPTNGSLVITAPVPDSASGVTWTQGTGNSARAFLSPDGFGDFNWHVPRGGTLNDGLVMSPEGRVALHGAPFDAGIVSMNSPTLTPEGGFAFHAVGHGSTARAFHMPDGGNNTNFYLVRGGTLHAGIVINKDGGVGIANPPPFSGSHKLVVNGTTSTTVLTITGGSDLAEPVVVNSGADCGIAIEPGMLLVIDPERPGEFMLSTVEYDRAVGGIISGANGLNPGLIMRAEGQPHADGTFLMALSGKVWCWCDATASGPIRPGDMLTTSATPGHAMKALDPARSHGAVIGKAMTALAEDRGLVLVLVNLQ